MKYVSFIEKYSMLELHEFAILFIKGAQHEDENFFTSSEKTL